MKKLLAAFIVFMLLVAVAVECKKRSKGKCLSQKGKKVDQKLKKTHRQGKNAHQQGHNYLQPHQTQFWVQAVLALFLSLAGGFCSGMTVGLNSLSVLKLEIMSRSSNQQQKRMADRILNIISDHHLFLVTLLVGNAIVLESLPIVVHLIMPDWMAILVSTFMVLIVAEVVPMSFSTGNHKYTIAYYGAPLVGVLIKVFYIICYPMARGLDKLLGHTHEQRITRRDFLTFIKDNNQTNNIEKIEVEFINQVMNSNNKTIQQFMVPYKQLFILEEEKVVTKELVQQIALNQYNYILICRGVEKRIYGYFKGKDFVWKVMKMDVNALGKVNVKDVMGEGVRRKLIKVYKDIVAVQMLQFFKKTNNKIILVCESTIHEEDKQQSDKHIFTFQELIVSNESTIIGAISLPEVLNELCAFPTSQLSKITRRVSGI